MGKLFQKPIGNYSYLLITISNELFVVIGVAGAGFLHVKGKLFQNRTGLVLKKLEGRVKLFLTGTFYIPRKH